MSSGVVMSVQAHPCPGTHHLELTALRTAVLIDDDHKLYALLDGCEYHLIDECPEWPAYMAARLIPQEAHSLPPARRTLNPRRMSDLGRFSTQQGHEGSEV